jgi:hypothetical protein
VDHLNAIGDVRFQGLHACAYPRKDALIVRPIENCRWIDVVRRRDEQAELRGLDGAEQLQPRDGCLGQRSHLGLGDN